MLKLTAYVPDDDAADICRLLTSLEGVKHVVSGGLTTDGQRVLTGRISTASVDEIFDALDERGVPSSDVYIARSELVEPVDAPVADEDGDSDGRTRVEMVRRAAENARFGRSFILTMVAAGVIAGVGVLTGSSILVVGAMAISADMLLIVAAAVALVERRWFLALRALTALGIGLAIGAAAAFGAIMLMRLNGHSIDDLQLADNVLGPSLTELGPGSLLVALAAGLAGMLAVERVGGEVIGVAISVTTIPAAAYIGDALALGAPGALGALEVLLTNIVVTVLAGAATFALTRRAASTWRRGIHPLRARRTS